MRIFWLECLLALGLVCLCQAVLSQGFTIKIKLKKDVFLKITLFGKKKNETGTDVNLPFTDKEQWTSLRSTMIGNTPEENIDKTTSLFDQIVVVNAFARSEANDDKYIFQGDILMDVNDLKPPNQGRRKRAIVAFEYFRWDVTHGVPYKLHESLDDATRRLILGAMREWEQSLPCLKWRVKTDNDVNFVHFFKGEGCYSKVGRTTGEQPLSIGRGCEVHGIVLHEMGHALGMFHEQSRPDRDDYVNIIKENILDGFETQFEKFGEDIINSYHIDYDYSSIMHYSATAFAKSRGLVTIEPRPKRDVKFGQRDHLSERDIQQARAMYGCVNTEFIATPVSTTLPTTQVTEMKTDPTTRAITTARQVTTELETSSGVGPAPETTKPTTIEVQTDGVTENDLTTEAITTAPLTEIPTQAPSSVVTGVFVTPELRTDAAGGGTTTSIPTIISGKNTSPETVPEPTTESYTRKPKVCVDLISTCYKWIRKGYCSPVSSYYSYMKYFCSRTCEMWKDSAFSRGATCVDLLPDCEAKAAIGHCTSLDHREYMENMCCQSCRFDTCIDNNPSCATWASLGACDTSGYVQKHCKKSCNLCNI